MLIQQTTLFCLHQSHGLAAGFKDCMVFFTPYNQLNMSMAGSQRDIWLIHSLLKCILRLHGYSR